MTERWKPETHEMYWFIPKDGEVIPFCWCDDEIDRTCFNFGNCFRTEEEAEAAAEKVKDLLLNLHKNPENLRKSEEPSQNLRALSKLCETLDKEIAGTREVRDNLQKSVNTEATRLRTLEEVRCEVKMMMEAEE